MTSLMQMKWPEECYGKVTLINEGFLNKNTAADIIFISRDDVASRGILDKNIEKLSTL